MVKYFKYRKVKEYPKQVQENISLVNFTQCFIKINWYEYHYIKLTKLIKSFSQRRIK